MSNTPLPTSGNHCYVEFRDNSVVKTTITTLRESDALAMAEDIDTYARQLSTTPIQATALLGASAIPIPGGRFVVEHVQEFIEGPRLSEMPWYERVPAARRVMGQLATMQTLSDGTSLVVPIDAHGGNFIVDPVLGPRFVDFVPALCRDDKGDFKTPNSDPGAAKIFSDRVCVMARFVWSCLDLFGQGSNRRDIFKETDIACRTLLPDDLTRNERNSIRKYVLAMAATSLEKQAAFTHS